MKVKVKTNTELIKKSIDSLYDGNKSEVAREIGCGRTQISMIVSGERALSVPYLFALSKALGLPLESLVIVEREGE